jgi:hypothetical protein
MHTRALAIAGLLIGAPGWLSAQTYCVSPSDTTAQGLLAGARALASRTNASYVDARARGGITFMSAANVTYVVDERTCQRIAQALAADAQSVGKPSSNRVRAVRIGEVFMAQDPVLGRDGDPYTYHLTKAYKVMRRIGP